METDAESMMWTSAYVIFSIFTLWLISKLFIWWVAKMIKNKFEIDVAVKSVGLFSAKDISIRVNQLQTIEIDKIALQLKLLNREASHTVNLHVGEIRVRGEMNKITTPLSTFDNHTSHVKTHRRTGSFARRQLAFINFVQKLFKYVSVNVDMLNIMVLNAFLPDSLLHFNMKGIRLASEQYFCISDNVTPCAVCGSLSVESIHGKILKSPKEVSQITSCIAEVSTSLQIVIAAEQIFPNLDLTSVEANCSKLQVDIHEGALIPGIMLPKLVVPMQETEETKSPPGLLENLESLINKVVSHLPVKSVISVKNFGLAFYGDETMGETTRGAHVCSSNIILHQYKDDHNLVPVFFSRQDFNGFKVPSGSIRFQVDDMTMTDYYKHRVADMGKTVVETKLTSNGVLSTCVDFTSWHADYLHKESVEFWSIIIRKLQDAQRQKSFLLETVKHKTPSPSTQKHRTRTISAPDTLFKFSHPDILQGTENSPFQSTVPIKPLQSNSLTSLLNTMDISIVFECTIYDASIDVIMTTVMDGEVQQDPPGFSIGIDSFTGSIDQSPNSRDLNFMSKLDRCWCIVNQDGNAMQVRNTGESIAYTQIHSPYRQNIHQWGRACNLDNLHLHGSATFKPTYSTDEEELVSEISLLLDVKVIGLQLELSKCAGQALASVLQVLGKSKNCQEPHRTRTFYRQSTVATPYMVAVEDTTPLPHPNPQHRYKFTVACVEAEFSNVNLFILSSDETRCADCLVVRIDQFKTELSGGSSGNIDEDDAGVCRNMTVLGVAVTAVHNPYFSAFASYEAGLTGRMPTTSVSSSVRKEQTRVAEYRCVEAAFVIPSYLSFDVLEVTYTVNYSSPVPSLDRDERVLRQLSASLSSESDVKLHWSPALHALVHHELTDFQTCLKPFLATKPLKKLSPSHSRPHIHNDGDHHTAHTQPQRHKSSVTMFGDARASSPRKSKHPIRFSVNITSSVLHFDLYDKRNVEIRISPFSCDQINQVNNISFDKLSIMMDGNKIFQFTNNIIQLSSYNEICQRDRQGFNDLKTTSNRVWSFKIGSWVCHFPYKYDFAATFDKAINVWKWVKGLYRKKSHPFRSPRLPPDLLICITEFRFELADWEFESRLHDNHELMVDEWVESEKRRRVLDQKMAEIRKQRGEMLPAKKVEDLYCRLEEENTKIYLSRCREMYQGKPPTLHTMPIHISANPETPVINPSGPTPLSFMWQLSDFSATVHNTKLTQLFLLCLHAWTMYTDQVEELYCQLSKASINIYLNRSRKLYTNPVQVNLLTWTVSNFQLSVLADESMHGMENAMRTIRTIDNVSTFPFSNDTDCDPEFVTLWCRCISLRAANHQVRLRNYPQCLMDYSDWKIYGKFCGAEQKGPPSSQRTEYVHLPAPWGPAKVERNMPALKFYHDLSSEVHVFNMAWGPCWEPAWGQVNLATNLLTKATVDPSTPLPWWDKSRNLLHGRFAMSMDRANLLHLASLDPYNTTEHMHWDWKNLYMDWTPGCFLYKGDLDIHIRNASKYDDVRFLHLPQLKMEWKFKWVCLDAADPHDHHHALPHAPDKIEGDLSEHDSYRYFRSRNIDLEINLDTRSHTREYSSAGKDGSERDKPEMLLYSTTLRWLSNFGYAVNAVSRPVCKGPIFGNEAPPKLKLSRHYRNVKPSFQFPELKVSYWSSYAQQLGIEWICGAGKIDSHFRLNLVPYDGNLIRRSMGQWQIMATTCELSNTKIYLLKRQESSSQNQSPSNRSLGAERNFLLSLSSMSYRRDNVSDGLNTPDNLSPTKHSTFKGISDPQARKKEFEETKYKKKKTKKQTSPTKRPQNQHSLIVHDLKAMWTTENRDVGYGLYEGYNKAAVLRRNLSTKVLSRLRVPNNEGGLQRGESARKPSQATPEFETSSSSGFGRKMMDPSLLHKLLAESDNRFVVGTDETVTSQQKLRGVAACKMDDVVNKNWLIKFVNCQVMLKGPQTQGYLIMTAAMADFLNRDHQVMWRDCQLTTKSSWVVSLTGTQIFATVEKNAASSGQDGENVPWLSVSDIEPRGPSPGMLDISDLMGGGQAIGGVVGDGVSAGTFQLQRIMSRCTCRMYYVGYEALVDSEQTDYGQLLPSTPALEEKLTSQRNRLAGNDLLGVEKPCNVLTIVQPNLEICTNASQFTMILDIVENLLLYVEPVMREHWERVDRMRFTLRLTSTDDVKKHRDTLATMQNRIRLRLTNMRQLERQLFRTDRVGGIFLQNQWLNQQCLNLKRKLAEEKERLNRLGIIIRCFKEIFLDQKTRSSSLRPQHPDQVDEEEEASVVRTTEVTFGEVKWHVTDKDGQLNIAQFEMRDFLYEKVNKSDDSVAHCFELAWLRLQNLLPNSLYRDVIKPRHQAGLRSHGVTAGGGRSLILRVLCKVRPPVGGISVKDHVEVNAVPLTIQLTYQFFKRMMSFFFPDRSMAPPGAEDMDDRAMSSVDTRNATLLGFAGNSALERHGSVVSLPARPPPPSPSHMSTPGTLRRNKSSTKRSMVSEAVDDVDKMKLRAAKNNTFLYIKITEVPLCVSYKGEKEKNIEDVRDFNVTIPMLEYHSKTWTWHDFAMAVKRDCKKQLVSQLIKEKLHISGRGQQQHSTTSESQDPESSSAAAEIDKAKILFGNSLRRTDSTRRSIFRKKK
ncbi:bridge-like lipid transfer protein family member 2 [Ciona intestinalis]